ncbi:MAG: O-antigen ligase family protein [Thermodesulfobacteriota bacterium]|nr:MAG: O-antigen ligase family protein [Thermodesulfobacteriota bacterium]
MPPFSTAGDGSREGNNLNTSGPSNSPTPALERAALASMGVYLFALNLPGVVTLREAGFFLALFLAAAHMWRKGRVEWPPMRLLLFIWPALALLTIIPGEDVSRSLSEIKKEIVYPVLAFWVFYAMTRSGRDFAYLGMWFLSGAALMVAAGIYFYYVLGLGFDSLEESGFAYGKRAYYGFFMASAAVVGLGLGLARGPGWVRAFALGLAPLCMLGIYFARLRAGYLAVIAAAAVFIIYGKILRYGLKVRLASIAVAALVLVSVVPMVSTTRDLNMDLSIEGWRGAIKELKVEERWIIWEGSFREIMKRPFQGLGFGNKEIFVPAFRLGHVYPHNLFLSYGVMAGAGGIIFLLLLFWRLFSLMHSAVSISRPGKEGFYIGVSGVGLLLAFLVLNMTEDIMTRHTGQTFWALSGMVLGSLKSSGTDERRPA